jgi:hypothetical protein
MTDLVSQIVQGTDQAMVAPSFVFSRQPQDQLLYLLALRDPSHGRSLFGAIKLPSDQLSMPAEDGFRPNDLGYFGQDLSTKAFADFGQADTLWITQSQPSPNLVSEDAVFSDQVLVAEKELLID